MRTGGGIWLLLTILGVLAIIVVGLFQFIRAGWEYRSGGGPAAYAHGYQWAKKHEVKDWRLCPEWPGKFNNGCTAYIEEQINNGSPEDRWAKLGKPCIKDCSGHEAGYTWAEKRDVVTEEDCSGQSQSFREGCIAYVEEQYRR